MGTAVDRIVAKKSGFGFAVELGFVVYGRTKLDRIAVPSIWTCGWSPAKSII